MKRANVLSVVALGVGLLVLLQFSSTWQQTACLKTHLNAAPTAEASSSFSFSTAAAGAPKKFAAVTFYDARPEHPYAALVCLLGQRLQLHAPTLDRIVLYDAAATDDNNSSPTWRDIQILQRMCGWKALPMQKVPAPTCGKAPVYEKQSIKLRAWQLTQYDMVMYLDGDHWITGSLQPLLDAAWKQLSLANSSVTTTTTPTIIGCRAMGAQGWEDRRQAKPNEFILNGGMMLFRPNNAEFDRIVSFHDKVPSNLIGTSGLDCTEMGMLNAAYQNKEQGILQVPPDGLETLVCPDLWMINNKPEYLCNLIDQSKEALPESHAMHGLGPIMLHSFKGFASSRQVYTERGVLPNTWTEQVLLQPADKALQAVVAEFPALEHNGGGGGTTTTTHPSHQVCQTGVSMTTPVCDPTHGVEFLGGCMCKPGFTGPTCNQPSPQPLSACSQSSDACLVHPDFGVAQVPLERWKRAQSGEKGYWDVVMPKKTDENDSDHASDMVLGFRNYTMLPRELGNVVEVGAGPYTQLKFILLADPANPIHATAATLVDPLIDYYLTNPRCPYRNGTLVGVPVTKNAAGGEDMDFDEQFDTLVMLNTLEHCRDAYSVMRNAHKALKPGGTMIFWDTIWDNPDPRAPIDYDRHLHPIRLTTRVFDQFLSAFEPIFDERRKERRGVSLYFVGKKK